MRVYEDVEFTVSGTTASELANAALARLEQLNDGPLSSDRSPHLTVEPELIDGAGVVCRWRARVSYSLPIDVEYEGAGPDPDRVIGAGESHADG